MHETVPCVLVSSQLSNCGVSKDTKTMKTLENPPEQYNDINYDILPAFILARY